MSKDSRKLLASITFPKKYIQEGLAWKDFSFAFDGSYIILFGDPEPWELIKKCQNGDLIYGKYLEDRELSES